MGRTDPLVEPGGGDAHEAAAAEDHADTGPVRGQPLFTARVGDGVGDGAQGEQLIGLGASDGGGHDAEAGGVEGGRIVQEAAPAAVEAVAAGGAFGALRVVVDVRVPAVGRRRP